MTTKQAIGLGMLAAPVILTLVVIAFQLIRQNGFGVVALIVGFAYLLTGLRLLFPPQY